MSKRVREDNSWDNFVTNVRATIEKDHEEVNTIESSPLNIRLFMSTGSRISIPLFGILKYRNYTMNVVISTKTIGLKDILYISVSYTEKKVKFDETRPLGIIFQSPKEYLESTLQLKDKQTIELVDRTISDVFGKFKTQMNWNGDPYQMIYFKKHNQIILRFKFKESIISFDKEIRENSLKTSWIEYATRTKFFFLVSVIPNCC